MNKIIKTISTATLFIASSYSMAENSDFTFSGYVRSSVMFDSDLADLGTSSNVNPDQIGKLGNQHDSFMAVNMNKKWTGEKGSWADYTFGFVVLDAAPIAEDDGVDTREGDLENIQLPTIGSNYFKMGGLDFMPEGSNIWVGTRRIFSELLLLNQKHRLLNGTGFGYESKSFDFTVMKEFNPGDTGEQDQGTAFNIQYRKGKLEFEATYTQIDIESNIIWPDGANGEGESSIALNMAYKDDNFFLFMPGSTTYRAQYGNNMDGNHLNYTYVLDGTDVYRISAEGKYSISTSLALKTMTYFETEMLDEQDNDTSVIAAGANIGQTLNNNFGMEYEFFYASIDDGDQYSQYKLAIGPTLQLKTLPFIRPIIKTNVSLIGGDEEVTGLDSSNEVRFTVLAEAYF